MLGQATVVDIKTAAKKGAKSRNDALTNEASVGYLRDHDVPMVLNRILKKVFAERPSDPLSMLEAELRLAAAAVPLQPPAATVQTAVNHRNAVPTGVARTQEKPASRNLPQEHLPPSPPLAAPNGSSVQPANETTLAVVHPQPAPASSAQEAAASAPPIAATTGDSISIVSLPPANDSSTPGERNAEHPAAPSVAPEDSLLAAPQAPETVSTAAEPSGVGEADLESEHGLVTHATPPPNEDDSGPAVATEQPQEEVSV